MVKSAIHYRVYDRNGAELSRGVRYTVAQTRHGKGRALRLTLDRVMAEAAAHPLTVSTEGLEGVAYFDGEA